MKSRVRAATRLAAVLLVACASAETPGAATHVAPAAAPARARPARPARCREIPAGGALQPWIDRAEPGEALCLTAGEHLGPVLVASTLTLWGPPDAVMRTHRPGTAIEVTGKGTQLLGFRIDAAGGRYDREDAALRISGDDVLVEGLEITDATSGVVVEQARGVRLRRNRILGVPSVLTGLRGDAIRFWETRDSLIEDNEIAWARDIVIWYSPHNVVRHNRILHSRYGVHYMYSADNLFADNHVEHCVVGAFVMYSRGIRLTRNHFVDASGAAGIGVGLKDSGNITIEENLFVHDTIGLYLDASPLYLGDENRIERNRFRFAKTAVTFHGRASGNSFRHNELQGNQRQVEVEGGGDARESLWSQNSFDDYVGYDLDGDGVGDVPYALRSFSGQLTARYPVLQLFHGSPALMIVEVVSELVPLVRPRTLIVDERPRTRGLGPIAPSQAAHGVHAG